MTDKLKPCPFCGGDILTIASQPNHSDPLMDVYWFFVQCQNKTCMTEGPVDLGRSGAVEKWNERPSEALPLDIQWALNSGDGTYKP
jgi:Lar family restriction alleviation protein